MRLKPPVDLPRADRQRLASGFLRDIHSLAGPGQPSGEQRLQTNRARVSGGLPDGRQDTDGLGTVRRAPPLAGPNRSGERTVEQPDGVLAVVARHLAELVQDLALELPCGQVVAVEDLAEVFPTRLSRHHVTSSEGYISNGSTIHPPVTFSTAQYGSLRGVSVWTMLGRSSREGGSDGAQNRAESNIEGRRNGRCHPPPEVRRDPANAAR